MKVLVRKNSKKWNDFEIKEWEKADLEHYGRKVNWDKKDFNIVVKENNKIVGSLRMYIRVGICYIDSVIVSSELRGRGIGKILMDKAEELAKKNKVHKIYFHTGKDWDFVNFYEGLGYKITSDLPNHYLRVHFVEMTKFI